MEPTKLDIMRRDFPIGSRVQLAPHLDDWMRGDRYGYVILHGAHTVKVRLDSGREGRYFMEDLSTVDAPSTSDWKNDA